MTPNPAYREKAPRWPVVAVGGVVSLAVGAVYLGTLAPTVKVDINGDSTSVDYSYGDGGLGGWADIPANRDVNSGGKLQ